MTDDRTELLRLAVDGLMPFAAAEIARWTDDEKKAFAPIAADLISTGADELRNTDRRRRDAPRGQILAAITRGIALGAEAPGGVDWAGGHWCVAPHQGCLKRAVRAVNGAAL